MPSSNPMPDPAIGRKLGKYEILSRLSTGGMSEIWLAFQRGLGGFRKIVVLKQILPDIKGEEEFVRMFLDEARITGMFAHPNIAQVFDLDVSDGELFLAMEFVPGATLVEVARACRQANEPIPIGFTLMAVRDTALALHYAHTFTDPAGRALTVIHRDIAEKNIMVTYEGVTKLLDFGIAKNPDWSGRTTVGMVKGTTGYMSPEQITGQKLDGRTDIFSLGVVLHECLTGMRLFPQKSAEDAVMAVLREDAAPPSRQNRAISKEIDEVCAKALQRNREHRYATALELARDLERAGGGQIWLPEQAGALIKRFFTDRREQTRKLLEDTSGERTAEVRLSELLSQPEPQFAQPPPHRPRRPSGLELTTDPSLERPEMLTSVARPRRTGRASAESNIERPSLDYEPKTVLDVPLTPSSARKQLEVDTIPGRKLESLKATGPQAIAETLTGEETARRAVVRRAIIPVFLGALLALGLIAFGVWLFVPLEKLPLIGGQLGTPQTAPPPEPEKPPAPAEPPDAKPTVPETAAVADPEPKPAPEKIEKKRDKPPANEPTPHRKKVAARPQQEDPPKTEAKTRADPADEPGQLTLTTDVKFKVFYRSQELGETPLERRALPAGAHALKLVTQDGKSYRLVVDITPGALTNLRINVDTLPAWEP